MPLVLHIPVLPATHRSVEEQMITPSLSGVISLGHTVAVPLNTAKGDLVSLSHICIGGVQVAVGVAREPNFLKSFFGGRRH